MDSKPVAEFMLRSLTKDDLPFIFNSFLKSYRDAPAMAGVPNTLYYAGQHALIEKLMARPHATVMIACSKDDSSQIYGYAIAERWTSVAVLHWVYVKHPFRGFGVGKALEAAATHDMESIYYSHRVKPLERLLKSRTSYVFNPFLILDS